LQNYGWFKSHKHPISVGSISIWDAIPDSLSAMAGGALGDWLKHALSKWGLPTISSPFAPDPKTQVRRKIG
jgi:hypothetical protein